MDKISKLEKVREIDDAVLSCIAEGRDDIQLITSTTALKRSKVDWSFRKLEKLGLVTVDTPDGMVDRVVDGTRQVFQAPKRAELTELGEEYVDTQDIDLNGFEDLSRGELVLQVYELEKEVDELKSRFTVFRQQVQTMLQSDERD